MFIIKNGKVLRNKQFVNEDIAIKDGLIVKVGKNLEDENATVYDAKEKYIVPGFIDIHTHGGDGIDINAASSEDLDKVSKFFAKHGVTSFLASILTDTKAQTENAIDACVDRIEKGSSGADLFGIHLEGPFLNAKYKGAMPEKLLRSGDLDLVKSYQKRAKGNIRYITIAPEVGDNLKMIKGLKDLGIVVSMGHSDATYEETVAAIREGANAITHLMNAMRQIHQHEIGIAGAALIEDVYVETICDNRHLKESTVKFIYKIKPEELIIPITDCIMATGLPDGEYKLGINDVIVEDGDAKLKETKVRAGSTLTLDVAMKNIMQNTKKNLAHTVSLMTENPARLFNLKDRGILETGKRADIVVLNEDYSVEKTFIKGKIVYHKEK
ncbi:MAG: N-acetylglucosamine-6-phosphate deacetylase [Tissierellia bacterium]|nr:N-acetylglucosamine-6-phosphate deacetylase [Tissierellia bacterium]